MKIICTQENLKTGLSTVSRIISPTNTLPILNNVLLKTGGGQLKISSTNLELAINTIIRCKVEEDGETTVVAKTFNELINNLPNENLIITSKNGEVLIESEDENFKIKTLPPEEFPIIPQTEKVPQININNTQLKTSLNQVVFATSNNQTQPEISGVYIEIKNKKIIFAATDRYRLAEKKIEGEGDGEVIIPQKTAIELSRILGTHQEDVGIVFGENQIFFSIGNTQIISRLVDGQYPEYKNIIPENFKTTIVVDKSKLQNALKANSLFSQNTSSVKLEFSTETQKLIISSEEQDLGSGVVGIASKVIGESGTLLLNFKYVLDYLNQAHGEKVEIKVVNESSPAVFLIEGQPDYLYLVMPIKI